MNGRNSCLLITTTDERIDFLLVKDVQIIIKRNLERCIHAHTIPPYELFHVKQFICMLHLYHYNINISLKRNDS